MRVVDFAVSTGARRVLPLLLGALVLALAAGLSDPIARADNRRLNDSVVQNVYTAQREAGCTNALRIDPQLRQAAEWHADDVLQNHDLDGDIGSDGSTPQDRAHAAGFGGTASETVAINPALSITGLDLLNQWFSNPAYWATMRDCTNTAIGVWSVNSLDRTVVVAVYGRQS